MEEDQEQNLRQQLQQRTQYQEQHQQKPQQCKLMKGTSSITSGRTSSHKSSIHEMRNEDFVNRLMTATPAFFYSTSVGSNNFLFSDMLRSLVSARTNENIRNIQLQQTAALAKRSRKRPWSQHRSHFKENEVMPWRCNVQSTTNTCVSEKPLELTTNKSFEEFTNKYCEIELNGNMKYYHTDKTSVLDEPKQTVDASAGNASNQGTLTSTSPSATELPTPPPMWYPSLYPPYGIDPLHFFIDLRVSGHFYDRKKENTTPLASAESNENSTDADRTNTMRTKHRQGSAFTVPIPRSFDLKKCMPLPSLTHDAVNLSASATPPNATLEDSYSMTESKENLRNLSKSNASYMLQHLPRLYSQFTTRDLLAQTRQNIQAQQQNISMAAVTQVSNQESDNKSDQDGEDDSDGHTSADNYVVSDAAGLNTINSGHERDIDVEIVDCIKYRNDGDSSRCSSADDMTDFV